MKNIYNIFSSDARIYSGIEEAFQGTVEFRMELDSILSSCRTESEANERIASWHRENKFYIFVHLSTKEILGVWEKSSTEHPVSDFLFVTEYLPVDNYLSCFPDCYDYYVCADDLRGDVDKALSLYLKEISFAQTTCKKPLFLFEACDKWGDYLTWSLTEGCLVRISGYKGYLGDCFCFRKPGVSDILTVNREYSVVLPSSDLKNALGLSYSPFTIWMMTDRDRWVPRSLWEPVVESVPEEYSKTYNLAVSIVNYGRRNYIDCRDLFCRVETSLYRFERFLNLEAPIQLIEDEVHLLVRRCLDALEATDFS